MGKPIRYNKGADIRIGRNLISGAIQAFEFFGRFLHYPALTLLLFKSALITK